MPPPQLNLPSSSTVVCVPSVTILLMSCVSSIAVMMCSSPQLETSSLMMALQNGHHEVVKVLLSAGAKVDLLTKVSITSPSQRPCPELESYVLTFVVEIMGGGYSCVGLY